MKIGLIDVDGHHFPNLALMKLSGWHKAQGDTVEWWNETADTYDLVYMAKVFSDAYSPDIPEPQNARKVIKGGTGYAITLENGKEVYRKEKDPPFRTKSSISSRITAYIRNIPVMANPSTSRPLTAS